MEVVLTAICVMKVIGLKLRRTLVEYGYLKKR